MRNQWVLLVTQKWVHREQETHNNNVKIAWGIVLKTKRYKIIAAIF